MGELAGVIKIDNRIISDGKVGPMTKRLSQLYAQRSASEGVQVVAATAGSLVLPNQSGDGNHARNDRPGCDSGD
jgi:hypothetical protein